MAKTKNILILDDQPQWRLALSTLLKEEGYNVLEAENIENAKEIFLNNAIDLVSIDLRLIDDDSNNVGGLELLHTIKDKAPHIASIIITGYPDAIENKKSLDGFNTVLLKKFSTDEPFIYVETVKQLAPL